MESKFPPLYSDPFPLVSDPACVVDAMGVILCWYLPGCLTRERQVKFSMHPGPSVDVHPNIQEKIWNSVAHLQHLFYGGKPGGNWRNLGLLFKPSEECLSSAPGTANLSPGWFEQAHDVSVHLHHHESPFSTMFRDLSMT